ncbi:hypothetical protein [Clostridium sp. Marseille-P2415]|uniref:hypothetical protein n=1 Tax=Clostridium sp. Marseille-P2415 TaxID=1805471 RepID=UPI000988571C|nr:hypothetical protein [Clostridium sp. Marseille-P2415]
MKQLHKLIIVLCVVLTYTLLVSCKKEKVEYPPLLTEEEVLERLRDTYGEEFEIRRKIDLLSLGYWVKAPYGDLAEGIAYEVSPKSDSSFIFKVYTYRTYGNASPIPFSKSGGLHAELEYRDCYGQDLLEVRFQKKAEKYGIDYETEYGGFRAYPKVKKDDKSLIDKKDYHTSIKYYIYIKEEDIEEMAERISACVTELMEEYNYEKGINFNSWITLQVLFKDKEEKVETTNFIGRTLFDKRAGKEFDISKEALIYDMKNALEEKKNRFQK